MCFILRHFTVQSWLVWLGNLKALAASSAADHVGSTACTTRTDWLIDLCECLQWGLPLVDVLPTHGMEAAALTHCCRACMHTSSKRLNVGLKPV